MRLFNQIFQTKAWDYFPRSQTTIRKGTPFRVIGVKKTDEQHTTSQIRGAGQRIIKRKKVEDTRQFYYKQLSAQTRRKWREKEERERERERERGEREKEKEEVRLSGRQLIC